MVKIRDQEGGGLACRSGLAALAAFASTSIEKIGLAILFVGAPIILIVYFTYHKYLNEI